MADMLRKPEKQKVLSLSSVAVLEETVDWVKEVCDVHICEKQVVILLERLYYLQEKVCWEKKQMERTLCGGKYGIFIIECYLYN